MIFSIETDIIDAAISYGDVALDVLHQCAIAIIRGKHIVTIKIPDVKKLLNTLDKREREILIKRFGIDSKEPKTLEQIGNDLGFSKERIRQLENIALQKLRRTEKITKLRTYLEDDE